MKKHVLGIVLTLALLLGLASMGLASILWKTNAIPSMKVTLNYVDPTSGVNILRNYSGVGLNYLEINKDMGNNYHYVLLHTENYSNMEVELSAVGGGLSTTKGTEINGTWRAGLNDNTIKFGDTAEMALSDIRAVVMTGTNAVDIMSASSPTITMTAAGLLSIGGPDRVPAKVTVQVSTKGIPALLGSYTSIGNSFVPAPPSISGPPIANNITQDLAFGALAPTIDVIALSPNYSDPLTVDIPSGGSALNGTAVVSSNKIVYTPNEGFSGKDTFSYKLISGLLQSNTATVTVNVGPRPHAVLQDFASIPKDSNAADHALVSDWDSNFTLSVPSKSDMGGDLSVNSDKINYKPKAGFDGTDTATYTLTDKLARTITGTAVFEVSPHAVGDSIDSVGGAQVEVTTDTLLLNDSAGAVFDNAYSIPTYGAINVSGNNITYSPTTSSPSTEYFAYTIKNSTTGKKSIALVTVKIK